MEENAGSLAHQTDDPANQCDEKPLPEGSEDDGALGTAHGLITVLQVQNFEANGPEGNIGRLPHALLVRAAMVERCCDLPNQARPRAAVKMCKTCNTAHEILPRSVLSPPPERVNPASPAPPNPIDGGYHERLKFVNLFNFFFLFLGAMVRP